LQRFHALKPVRKLREEIEAFLLPLVDFVLMALCTSDILVQEIRVFFGFSCGLLAFCRTNPAVWSTGFMAQGIGPDAASGSLRLAKADILLFKINQSGCNCSGGVRPEFLPST